MREPVYGSLVKKLEETGSEISKEEEEAGHHHSGGFSCCGVAPNPTSTFPTSDSKLWVLFRHVYHIGEIEFVTSI